MGKAVWVNIGGTWKQVNNVWANIGGTWKQKVIPKGNISGIWKDFITYYAPQHFTIEYYGKRVISWDIKLNKLWDVDVIAAAGLNSNLDVSSLLYTKSGLFCIADAYGNHETYPSQLALLDPKTGAFIKNITLPTSPSGICGINTVISDLGDSNILCGLDRIYNSTWYYSLWRYNVSTNTWTQLINDDTNTIYPMWVDSSGNIYATYNIGTHLRKLTSTGSLIWDVATYQTYNWLIDTANSRLIAGSQRLTFNGSYSTGNTPNISMTYGYLCQNSLGQYIVITDKYTSDGNKIALYTTSTGALVKSVIPDLSLYGTDASFEDAFVDRNNNIYAPFHNSGYGNYPRFCMIYDKNLNVVTGPGQYNIAHHDYISDALDPIRDASSYYS